MDLEDKRALVTGATSGIGRAAALKRAEARAEVIVVGGDARPGADTVAAVEADGGSATFVAADLSDVESIARLGERTRDVDILLNNARIFSFAPTHEIDASSFESTFNTNVRAPFFRTAVIAPKMAARGGGSIVNVATHGCPLRAAGGQRVRRVKAKAAVVSLTRTWAAEYGPLGVRVNAVSAGTTRTEGPTGMREDTDQLAQTAPLGRPPALRRSPRPSFLASPRSSYVNGAILAADGGRTAV